MDPLTIGKYRIDGILGQGAMGIVYRGFDETVGRAVAIKTVRKEVAGSRSWDAVARFRSEARAAGRLSHPNIVTVYDFAEDEDSAHLVCEYVPGRGLDVWLGEHRRADLATALMWMGQLLDALACAHAHGVVHRDVKASNILVVGNRLLKLADFGIAHVDTADRTQVGLMIGTPSCMAPEQIRGGRIDGRTDVFAAGVLLYQLLTGVRPFNGLPETAMQQILTIDVPPPSRLCPGLAADIDAAVLRALARDPGQRHASAADFLAALRRAAAAAGLRGAGTGPGPGLQDDSDATRLVARTPRAPEESVAGMALHPHWHTPTERSWDPALLARVEQGLASHVGPIAGLLVRKASRAARTLDELVSQVARSIPAPADRDRFLGRLRGAVPGSRATIHRTGTASAPAAAKPGAKPATLDDATVAGIEQRLAERIGPLASVCIRRARREARSVADLCRRAAENVADLSARRAFLAECGTDASDGWDPDAPPEETSLG